MTDPLYLVYMAKILILKKEGIIEKISYKRSAYESVDDSNHKLGYISKSNGKQNSGTNGLINILLPYPHPTYDSEHVTRQKLEYFSAQISNTNTRKSNQI